MGGTYTKDYKETVILANNFNMKVVIPTYYGSIVGGKDEGEQFRRLVVDKNVVLKIK